MKERLVYNLIKLKFLFCFDMTELIVRPALDTEYKEIAEVFMQSFMKEPLEPEKKELIILRIKKNMQKKMPNFYVAEVNNKIVGIGGETCYRGVSIIGYIGVLPSYRRQGIGNSIFERVLNEAIKNNPTVELFSNLGIENLYRKFGFEDEFYTHILELQKFDTEIKLEVETLDTKIPSWIYKLDKTAVGFDRSKLLDHIMEDQDSIIVTYKKEGYAICNGKQIGPMIAKNKAAAKQIFDHFLSDGSKHVITPESYKMFFEQYKPQKIQSTLKMTFGEPLEIELSWIWSYSSFAFS